MDRFELVMNHASPYQCQKISIGMDEFFHSASSITSITEQVLFILLIQRGK